MSELPPWLSVAVERIRYLRTLGDGWDSYGASSVDPAVADTMGRFLADPRWASTPSPAIVPTVDGGLAVEWRNDRGDVVVEFSPNGSATAYVSNEVDAEWEGELAKVPGGLEAWAQGIAVDIEA